MRRPSGFRAGVLAILSVSGAAGQNYNASLVQGHALSPPAVEQAEAAIKANPYDLDARARLLGYYSAKAAQDANLRGERLRQIQWLVEHEPACPLLHEAAVRLRASDFAAPHGAYLESLRTAWQEQVDRHPDDVLVLENAVQSIRTLEENSDVWAENLAGYLKRLRVLEPGDPEWAVYLAGVYGQALTRDISPNATPETKLFATAARKQLNDSNDAAVVGLTGQQLRLTTQMLTGSPAAGSLVGLLLAPINTLGESLLRRAASVNPKNPNWGKLLAAPAPKDLKDLIATITETLQESDLWPGGTIRELVAPADAIQLSTEAEAAKRPTLAFASLPAFGGPCSLQFNALIGLDGRIRSLQMTGFDRLDVPFLEAARDALRQARYQPLNVNGEAVEAVTHINLSCPARPKQISAIGGLSGGIPFGDPLSKSMTPAPGNSASAGIEPGAYRVGNGISAPTLISKIEPVYTEEARAAKLSGTVVLSVVVDESGKPRNVKVTRPLGLGLDEKAVEAVQQWKFNPGRNQQGAPVPVAATVEVNFDLLDNPPRFFSPTRDVAAEGLSFSRIETIAGKDWKFTGDNLPARQAPLGRLRGIAYDREGNLYAADSGNQAIIKMDLQERVHVLAGPDSAPDYRPLDPFAVALDASGAVYFGESGQRVRKLLPGGQVLSLAGSDKRGFSADGSPAAGSPIGNVRGIAVAPDGSVVFSESSNHRIRRIDSQGRLETVAGDGRGRFAGDGGPATQASLRNPSGLTFDRNGNLFVADEGNARVRRIAADGTITTVVGPGMSTPAPGCPSGLVLNEKGDIFVADPCKRHVLAVRNGESTILGGDGTGIKEPSGDGGPATAASFDEWDLTVNGNDDLVVSGPDSGHLYRIGHEGIFSIIAGSGNWRVPADGTPGPNAWFQHPSHLARDASGSLLVTDFDAQRIYRLDRSGSITRVAGTGWAHSSGENAVAKDAAIDLPLGLRVRPNGAVVFSERGGSNRIREITPNGLLRTLAGVGRAGYSGDGGPAVRATLNAPLGICLDPSGALYIADTNNHRVRKVMPDGTILLVAGNGIKGYSGDGGPAQRAELDTPVAVEFGPDNSLYIADAGNHLVRKVADGTITTVAGNGVAGFAGDGGPAANASVNWPYDLAFGPDRALYILDTNAGRIRRIDGSSQTITTVAGNGTHILSGDGGPPSEAGLGQPEGLAFDDAGNLYVTDARSGRIRMMRRLRQFTPPSTVLGGIIGAIPQGAPPPAPVPSPAPDGPAGQQIRVGGAIMAARLIQRKAPVYPPTAKQARVQGVVRLSVIVGKDGKIDSVTLIQGHPFLVEAAINAVKEWVYQPTLVNGEAVSVQTEVDVQFNLDQ